MNSKMYTKILLMIYLPTLKMSKFLLITSHETLISPNLSMFAGSRSHCSPDSDSQQRPHANRARDPTLHPYHLLRRLLYRLHLLRASPHIRLPHHPGYRLFYGDGGRQCARGHRSNSHGMPNFVSYFERLFRFLIKAVH